MPNQTTISRLRKGKSDLRRDRVAMDLPEKVRQVVKLQEFAIETIRRRRPLRDHERVWRIHD
jgi:hypothetical protein